MKTFHFLTGLPRSGSTLLTVLLNQHPDIYSSHQTDLLTSMDIYQNQINGYESVQAGIETNNYYQVLESMAHNFYKDKTKPIILDKCRAWGVPKSLPFAHLINPQGKFLYSFRPILEVLTSFIVLAENNPNNFIDRMMNTEDFNVMHYRDINDARCDWLMRHNSQIDISILALGNLIKNHKEKVMIIEYDNLINNPSNELNKINAFLSVQDFKYAFTNINDVNVHEDEAVFGIKEMHKVRSSINKKEVKPENVLSDYVINKYGNALDFIKEF